MKPINSAVFAPPEAVPPAAKPCRESRLVRQYVDLQDTLAIGCAPIKASTLFQARLPDNLGRNSHLVLSSYPGNHG